MGHIDFMVQSTRITQELMYDILGARYQKVDSLCQTIHQIR